jgi:hypothetical protein
VAVGNTAAHAQLLLVDLCKMVPFTPPEEIAVLLLADRI